MLELSAKTNLLEENDYRYSLQDVKDPIHILKDIGLLVDLSYKLIENLDLLLSTSIFVFDCFVDCNFFHKSIE